MNNSSTADFHAWLFDKCRHGRTSVRDIMDDVASYGNYLPAFMPTNGIVCQEMLEKLERHGMAKRDGSWWMWSDKPEARPVEKQGSLFT